MPAAGLGPSRRGGQELRAAGDRGEVRQLRRPACIQEHHRRRRGEKVRQPLLGGVQQRRPGVGLRLHRHQAVHADKGGEQAGDEKKRYGQAALEPDPCGGRGQHQRRRGRRRRRRLQGQGWVQGQANAAGGVQEPGGKPGVDGYQRRCQQVSFVLHFGCSCC